MELTFDIRPEFRKQIIQCPGRETGAQSLQHFRAVAAGGRIVRVGKTDSHHRSDERRIAHPFLAGVCSGYHGTAQRIANPMKEMGLRAEAEVSGILMKEGSEQTGGDEVLGRHIRECRPVTLEISRFALAVFGIALADLGHGCTGCRTEEGEGIERGFRGQGQFLFGGERCGSGIRSFNGQKVRDDTENAIKVAIRVAINATIVRRNPPGGLGGLDNGVFALGEEWSADRHLNHHADHDHQSSHYESALSLQLVDHFLSLLVTEMFSQIVEKGFSVLDFRAHGGHFIQFARPFPASEPLPADNVQLMATCAGTLKFSRRAGEQQEPKRPEVHSPYYQRTMGSVRLLMASVCLASVIHAATSHATFYQDVLPILQQRCQTCHRPGEIGRMPLMSYSEARPWAQAIRESVTLRKMPPWFADPRFGKFRNDPSLTDGEISTIQAWADGGAPEGNRADAKPNSEWPQGWSILETKKPDLVIGMDKPFRLAAGAVVEYQYFVLPLGLAEDKWVRAVEIRPGDRTVVHHAVLYVREPGSAWRRGMAPAGKDSQTTKADILAIYTPGSPASTWPEGMAKKIPTGSDLVLQVHYTAKKTAAEDRTEIGLTFASEPPQQRVITLQMQNDGIRIQPGERDYRISVSGVLPRDALLLSFFPHMHLRGSGFQYQLVQSGGRVETLLQVNHYDFYWQLSYRLATPRQLKRGDRLLWTAYFDNSANNPHNPDPTAEVTWGEQSWEEMMVGFFDVAVDPSVDKIGFFSH
jgi:Copper type II ascorbate-dependent monooxygenase, C-terminal domain